MVNLKHLRFSVTLPKDVWEKQTVSLRNGAVVVFAKVKGCSDAEAFVNILTSSVTVQMKNELKNQFVAILEEDTGGGKSTTQVETLRKTKFFLSFAWCVFFREDFEEDYSVEEMTERLQLMTDLFSNREEMTEICRRFLLCTAIHEAYNTASAIIQWRVNHEKAKERKRKK
jgi:hypothetical protein